MALTSFLSTPLVRLLPLFNTTLVTKRQWVRVIEHTPRRPLLVYFLLASGVMAILFGLSSRVWHLIAIRATLGCCENLSLIANISVGELTDEEHRPQGR